LNRKILLILTAAAIAAGTCGGAVADAAVVVHDSPSPLVVLTEPQAGLGPIYQLIKGAHSSVDLTTYELADPTAEADLAADAARGVNVRVILDEHLEKSANTGAYHYLAAHGVHVRWGPAGVTYHQKTLTVDDATSVIMTLNLVAADYAGTRDFAVIDKKSADVAAIVTTFNAWSARRTSPLPASTTTGNSASSPITRGW
jgi:cardiolipin synthase A/B